MKKILVIIVLWSFYGLDNLYRADAKIILNGSSGSVEVVTNNHVSCRGFVSGDTVIVNDRGHNLIGIINRDDKTVIIQNLISTEDFHHGED